MKQLRRTASALALLAVISGACTDSGNGTASPTSTTSAGVATPPTTGPQVLVDDLRVPWGLAFLPNGDAVVTERQGRLNIIDVDEPAQRRTFNVPGVVAQREGGLLGVAVSPSYETDRWIYVYMTAASDNRVIRFRIGPDNASLIDTDVVVDGIDSASFHNGGRIAFGPDGMLYVATGDAGRTSSSQDQTDLNGKILRMTPDGGPAPGNPTANSVVYSSGHRNVQGLAWDRGGRLYATEFGQNTFDEVNLIQGGRNYGWPELEGDGNTRGGRYTDPVVTWTTDEASPSGVAFVQEQRGAALYVAALRGQRLWRIPLDGDGRTGEPEAILRGEFGRLRTTATAPDGSLWIMTSNSDGRGDGTPDRIIRLGTPAPQTTSGQTNGTDDEQAVRQAFEEVRAAMVDGRVDVLDRLLDDSYTATHITGYVSPKDEWLGQITAGDYDYHSIETQSVDIVLNADRATVVSEALFTVTLNGSDGRYRLRSTQEWVKTAGTWRAVRGVSTTA